MRPTRVSIFGLMMFVAGVAFFFVALRFSTPNVASTVILLTLFGLGMAILAAIYRRELRRAFWVGFAVMGWGYLGFAYSSWHFSDEELQILDGQGIKGGPRTTLGGHLLGTTTLLDDVRLSVQASNSRGVPSNQVASFLGLTDARTRAIVAALNRPVFMRFAGEVPLDDVLAYIKTATRGAELPEGIPIYVEPIGLEHPEKTGSAPISLDLEGVPLRRSLALLLQQLDLTYTVDDGVLTITSLAHRNTSIPVAIQSFRRVGHCLFAVVFGLIGGIAARVLHATRDPRQANST